jgi:hypothetical protein
MTPKTKNITGWILTGILAFVFLGSAFMKFKGGEEMAKNMAAMGLTASTVKIIGLVEVLSIVLFIIPRTGLLGTLLLAAYLGGAIATHLEHADSILVPTILQCIVWITAVIRFPELSQRITGSDTSSN